MLRCSSALKDHKLQYRNSLSLSNYTKKWSFPLRISSINVAKSAEYLFSLNCRPKACNFITKETMRIWLHLLKKSLVENFIFLAVSWRDILKGSNKKFQEQYPWNSIITVLSITKNVDFVLIQERVLLLYSEQYSYKICFSRFKVNHLGVKKVILHKAKQFQGKQWKDVA